MKTKVAVFAVVIALLVFTRLGKGQTLDKLTYLTYVSKNNIVETINITSVPTCKTAEDLSGIVTGVEPSEYRVVVYVMVEGGWWNKPYFAQPLTVINPDGTWLTDVTTGGNDGIASQFAAFLILYGYAPPLVGGSSTLPNELYNNSAADTVVERECPMKQISFSGYSWSVKDGLSPMGPGPNYFSDDIENVYVDDQNRLHLNILYRDNKWQCSEVILNESFGHGRYTFHIASPIDDLDMNVVAGLFTWCNASPENFYCEIDIEFSRWNIPGDDIAQYVVQPYTVPGNIHRFNWTQTGNASTHMFEWQEDHIYFQSFGGVQNQKWDYTGSDIPLPDNENARINLWLFNGLAPSDGNEVEVIFDGFEFEEMN